MKRIMIVGQPGSGKSTLARKLGAVTHLPVYHIDKEVHWMPGWIERPSAEKSKLCRDIHARAEWIFEGGHARTWDDRLAHADTLIWLDIPLWLRFWRVVKRTILSYGRSRPDLPEDCPEQFSWEFYTFIWRTRKTSRQAMERLFDTAPDAKSCHRFTNKQQVQAYLDGLKTAMRQGSLGLPHR